MTCGTAAEQDKARVRRGFGRTVQQGQEGAHKVHGDVSVQRARHREAVVDGRHVLGGGRGAPAGVRRGGRCCETRNPTQHAQRRHHRQATACFRARTSTTNAAGTRPGRRAAGGRRGWRQPVGRNDTPLTNPTECGLPRTREGNGGRVVQLQPGLGLVGCGATGRAHTAACVSVGPGTLFCFINSVAGFATQRTAAGHAPASRRAMSAASRG